MRSRDEKFWFILCVIECRLGVEVRLYIFSWFEIQMVFLFLVGKQQFVTFTFLKTLNAFKKTHVTCCCYNTERLTCVDSEFLKTSFNNSKWMRENQKSGKFYESSLKKIALIEILLRTLYVHQFLGHQS